MLYHRASPQPLVGTSDLFPGKVHVLALGPSLRTKVGITWAGLILPAWPGGCAPVPGLYTLPGAGQFAGSQVLSGIPDVHQSPAHPCSSPAHQASMRPQPPVSDSLLEQEVTLSLPPTSWHVSWESIWCPHLSMPYSHICPPASVSPCS